MIFDMAQWINKPKEKSVEKNRVRIVTDPGTDFWQRSYYGFQNDNAPALLRKSQDNFTFTTKIDFQYNDRFDQCGVIIYLDSENWFKASVEYENKQFSRLGSVVTNHGYSDWATTDIETPPFIWYRLSRRGPDFLIESSFDGKIFSQMRIFHLQLLGETTEQMGKDHFPDGKQRPVPFGLYACSPLPSSFTAEFSNFTLGKCLWKSHF